MAVFFVTGKLGSGKTLASVGRMREALLEGRRIAGNLDVHPEQLAGAKRGTSVAYQRVPDKPRVEDLEALGLGYEGPLDESRNGVLVLDELGTWLNSRSWSDKERAAVLDWFLHARKRRWDVLLLVQNVEVVDKQLRQSLCEHLVDCKRLDRVPIPVIGKIIGARFPKIHTGTVYLGDTTSALKVDRWWYRGRDLYGAFDTEQVFDDGHEWSDRQGQRIDYRATWCQLPAATWRRWYQPPPLRVRFARVPAFLFLLLFIAPLLTVLAIREAVGAGVGTRSGPAPDPKALLRGAFRLPFTLSGVASYSHGP